MMKGIVIALCLVALLACVGEAKKWRSYVDLHRHHEAYLAYYRSMNPDAPEPSYQNFTQRLNHFDEQDQRTWEQRYVVNDAFWNGTGPIFFLVNGEGPMDPLSAVVYQYVAWAQQFGALVVSLEHRYYGGSQPTEDISTENLKFLSAEQALADAANFISFIITSNKAEGMPVVTFGGSYAGMLSGWMRQKYPQLIDFSVASSGPVHAEVDFYQYLAVVADSLTTLGSAECVSNIALATQKIQAMTTSESGLASLSSLFNTCATIEQEDIPVFMQSLAGNFMGVTQYNLEAPGVNITTLCDMITAPGQDPLTNYVALWNAFAGNECIDVSYEDMIEELKNDSIFTGVGGRQWFYQTCIEFGYFQTSDSPNQPFGNLFNVSTQTQQCLDVFDFEFLPDVNWTRTEFGDRDPDGSDTIWVNGSIDPWHALGVLPTTTPPNAPFKTLLINGTAHCADMIPPFSGSPASLQAAQQVIGQQLATWLTTFNK